MTYTMFYRAIPGGIATAVLTLSLLLGLPGNGVAADQPAEELTYAKHVAPIFQEKCQDCHQPNSIAPMSLLTYEEVKSYAPMIRAKVAARVMPPWHIDRTVGIKEFKNDRGLTDEQIETVVGWIDAGAPFGDKSDLPRTRRTSGLGQSLRQDLQRRAGCGPSRSNLPILMAAELSIMRLLFLSKTRKGSQS